MEYKYYSYGQTVIRVTQDSNWRNAVLTMRRVCNYNSIMIEDMESSDIEEYVEYLERSVKSLRSTLEVTQDRLNRARVNSTDSSHPLG